MSEEIELFIKQINLFLMVQQIIIDYFDLKVLFNYKDKHNIIFFKLKYIQK